MRRRGQSATIGLLAMLIGASPALADAIDGHWCAKDARRLQIEGPSLVTPGGHRMQGNYDRHHFSYVAPAADMGAGQAITMILMGETAVQIQVGADVPEVWNRCAPPLSLLREYAPEPRTENG